MVHRTDVDTAAYAAQLASTWPELRSATTAVAGLVAAFNCGLAAVRGEIVAFIDDDAVPTPEIIYDPNIRVLRYPAARPHGDERNQFVRDVVAASAHNEALAIPDYLPPSRRLVYAVYMVALGNTDAPGLAVLARDLARRRPAPGRGSAPRSAGGPPRGEAFGSAGKG